MALIPTVISSIFGVFLVVVGFLAAAHCGGAALVYFGAAALAFGVAIAFSTGLKTLVLFLPAGAILLILGYVLSQVGGCWWWLH